MSITRIKIENYRSIKYCVLDFKDINLLIGENGTGKSNILDAVRHFYRCLLQENDDIACYNYQNRFSNEFSISLMFDFRHLKMISGRNRQRNADLDYEGYYNWISRRKPFETLTMRQIKGKPVRWNQERQYRQNILNLFPLYVVDARKIDLTDWSQLWDMIGDLMKVHRTREAEIAAEITAIKDNEKYKLEERFEKLLASFARADIQIKPYTPKQYASTMSTLLFKGETFSFKASKLDYMSNGTNAFNYTNLLIEILKLIFEYKIKEPIVILDEPEISLHHKLVDRLTARILGCKDAIRFLIATHSPRMLKDILKLEQSDCEVVHVSLLNGRTYAAPVKLFSEDSDNRLRVFMNDQHANAYFSRYILSVEGASEVEVFSNAFLLELFPFLRDVDIMEGMADDVIQKIISPRHRHFHTQFLFLADMDKAMRWSTNNKSFQLEGRYFPKKDLPEEKYYYSPMRTHQLLCLKRIRALSERGRFRYWPPFFACRDLNFQELIQLIKDYLKQRNVYVASTTIEGMLITDRNLSAFWTYCQEAKVFRPTVLPELQKVYDSLPQNDCLNFVRLLFDGKSDFILTFDEICKRNPKIAPDLKRLIENNKQGKTNGWMSDWLDYFLCRAAASDSDTPCGSLGQFSKAVADSDIHFQVRQSFRDYFPELFEVVEIMRKQMSGK